MLVYVHEEIEKLSNYLSVQVSGLHNNEILFLECCFRSPYVYAKKDIFPLLLRTQHSLFREAAEQGHSKR